MDKLANLPPIIKANLAALRQPGVVAIRPGYQLKDGWISEQPAIVVVVDQKVPVPQLPANVGGHPIEIRRTTVIEQIRRDDPVAPAEVSAIRPEFGEGGFIDDSPAVPQGAIHAVAIAGVAPAAVAAAVVAPALAYSPPPGGSLAPVTARMKIICHASPDAGWPMLQAFLKGTQKTLTVGMYEFTSGHILDTLDSVIAAIPTPPGPALTLTLDDPRPRHAGDQSDPQAVLQLQHDLGARFESAWALAGSNPLVQHPIFPYSYHIKTAVRDNSVVWLSSGNCNNTNQPDFDPLQQPRNNNDEVAADSDRDWHVIVENAQLAQTLETYLSHDFDVAAAQATPAASPPPGPTSTTATGLAGVDLNFRTPGCWRFFAPLSVDEKVTITPLLTPDVGSYATKMLTLLQRANESLYIQLQYIHQPTDPVSDVPFQALIDIVGQKIADGIDVRIILSQYQLEATSKGTYLEQLQAAGVSAKNVKIQLRVHNKGFLIDGKIAVVGSHNWSGAGVLRNRDASLIIENETIAQYFQGIFLHDWKSLARQTLTPNAP